MQTHFDGNNKRHVTGTRYSKILHKIIIGYYSILLFKNVKI